MAKSLATPGVYIEEKSVFPNAEIPVPTAVPAFIGYTQQATRNNHDLTNIPTRISSFGEYLHYFGGAPNTLYRIEVDADKQGEYKLSTKTSSRFLLFFSMKLFFANGGADCYIVSVGNYECTPQKADFNSEGVDAMSNEIILKGIPTLEREQEPTIIVIPDAVLLGATDCAALQQDMLLHCNKMGNRFAILDVFLYENAPITPDIIAEFRNNIGLNNLMWGAAYYPWVRTNITGADSVNFKNIDESSIDTLILLLSTEVDERIKAGLDIAQGAAIKTEINAIKSIENETAVNAEMVKSTIDNLNQKVSAVSPLYKAIVSSLCEKLNLLPPSGGIAGIYAMVDRQNGVFQSPANVSFSSVIKPLVNLTEGEQEDLNVPLNGKAVNAIRAFPEKGVLIWGARTLDGNSLDWRYISVRRTVIFIEQSIKYAIEPYAFSPNTASTWTNVQALISNFLTNFWASGGLAGAIAPDVFSVGVGLGVTMTPIDIQEGIMRVSVRIAVIRPAEFIEITFQQKMQSPVNS